jgi:hypothetical protein
MARRTTKLTSRLSVAVNANVLATCPGTGTTVAVPYKMGRRGSGIEMGEPVGGGFRLLRRGPPPFGEQGDTHLVVRFADLVAFISTRSSAAGRMPFRA